MLFGTDNENSNAQSLNSGCERQQAPDQSSGRTSRRDPHRSGHHYVTRNYEFHERRDRLAAAEADRDVLVTLTVPPDGSIGEARQSIETDYAEATQLDERSFPKPLVEALEEAKRLLNEYDELPENGLAVYRQAARDALESFFDEIRADGDGVAYGVDEVDDTLEYDAVEMVLLSTAVDGQRLQTFGDRAVDQGGETVVILDDFPAESGSPTRSTASERSCDFRSSEFNPKPAIVASGSLRRFSGRCPVRSSYRFSR
ncbi:hypothetical protein [Halostagnicola bangensis]